MGNNSSVLSGFTLTNGYTTCTSATSGGYGGGVNGSSGGSFPGVGKVENCIIRNCAAIRGGGANGVQCVNCRFYNNASSYIGVAANYCELVNCFFSGHAKGDGSYVTLNCFNIRNCTFMDDNQVGVATYYSAGVKDAVTNVCNSLILCAQRQEACYTRCVFSTDAATRVPDDKIGEGSVKMAKSQMGIDAEGRPTSKSSILVDRGRDDMYKLLTFEAGDKDLEGGQRVYNGAIDIGCHEFDWRGDFARALGRSPSFGVAAASPSVTTNAAGGILLPADGATATAQWTSRTAPKNAEYHFSAQVYGDATLSMFRDGADEPWATLTAADGARVYSFGSATATNTVSFALSGEGSAVLSDFSKRCGAVLLMR